MQKALETNPMPIGIFYQNKKLTFEEHIWGNEKKALVTLTHDIIKLQELFDSY
jgi:2-oxoglutarate ferredoxin oxidoreductase subunit beta